LSELKRGQTVGARVSGSSVTRTAWSFWCLESYGIQGYVGTL